MAADQLRTVVIIPTYNERHNIASIIARLRAAVPTAHTLVVDDASPDGTGDIADALATGDRAVHVLHRTGKSGLGSAYRAGFDWALARDYDVIVEMDADWSHRPEDLPRLLDALAVADVVLGSRWVPGGRVLGWPRSRMLLSRGGSWYARRALGLRQRDATGGFRAFRSDAIRRIEHTTVTSQGYCFQIEMLWRAHRAGLRIAELPITFEERRFGNSKMSTRIVLEAMARVTGWGLEALPSRIGRRYLGQRYGVSISSGATGAPSPRGV